ncbi:MAG TPA: Rieske 2Fe-2S domain-containing protein [Rhizomicrobium sp.]|nr:Rieske 2Fe-2S domain-containing protein [Rhizomicrobium sp.]
MSAVPPRLEGTAYGRGPQHPNDLLTRVGPGTPCGEFLRRYWQPVLASHSVTTRPREVRILGEDLIIFRDRKGRPGLLYPRCMHRGTNLFWGRVEDEGIRCCYHGWLFGVDGQCLEQPCEPNKGVNLASARQPWYPLEERYGLVWAYMGPPDKMPVLRRFDCMEPLEDGETYVANDASLGSHGDPNGPDVVPYSWLHMNDNIMDPFHVQVLHSTFSVTHFVREFEVMPTVKFEDIDAGVIYKAHRKLDDGREVDRVSTWMIPNIMSVPNVQLIHGRSNGLGFSVPVDDTHSRILFCSRQVPNEDRRRGTGLSNLKPWSEMTIEERQDRPGDYEAQAGQGPISLHSEEHLVTSDRGIAMQRRMLEREIRKVMDGGDPLGVAFGTDDMVRVPSGNFFR